MSLRGLKFVAITILCGAMSCGIAAAQLDDPAVAKQKYETFKARVMGGDLTVDWPAFRLSAMVAGVNGSFEWQKVRNQVNQDVDAGKLDKALAGAQQIIDHNMANPEGHLLAVAVYDKMGKDAERTKELNIVKAIVKSIFDSGDGKSSKTAWFTVDPSEEYFFIEVVLNGRPKGQALVNEDGHAYDKMTITDEKGAEQTVWFNTDTDMQIMDAALNPKSKKR
jgi:Domain of unknown function (DUF4919)